MGPWYEIAVQMHLDALREAEASRVTATGVPRRRPWLGLAALGIVGLIVALL